MLGNKRIKTAHKFTTGLISFTVPIDASVISQEWMLPNGYG